MGRGLPGFSWVTLGKGRRREEDDAGHCDACVLETALQKQDSGGGGANLTQFGPGWMVTRTVDLQKMRKLGKSSHESSVGIFLKNQGKQKIAEGAIGTLSLSLFRMFYPNLMIPWQVHSKGCYAQSGKSGKSEFQRLWVGSG